MPGYMRGPNVMGKSSSMFILLVLSVFLYHLGMGFYFTAGLEPLPTLEFLYLAAFLCGIVWWLKSEAQEHQFSNLYCSGITVGYGWLVVVPYYLFKSRGWKGFIPILAVIGSIVAGRVIGMILGAAI
jgi:hypothetical protein